MEHKVKHLMYTPFTGLGLYNGFRGNRWLRNRIQIFKQFVIPSLQAQTCKDFTLWISWRPEEKTNKYVKELQTYLEGIKEFKTVHTFHGVCFYDDKYEDSVAREKFLNNIHYTMGGLHDTVADSDYVLMTIQPSDDLYDKHAVEILQYMFANEDWQAIGFKKGYIMNYWTKEVAEYNPTTNPPFATIKFPRKEFLGQSPINHLDYTALKHDVGKYKKGTPLPSHEYYKDVFGDKYCVINERGFMVGTHKQNISTTWQIPFKGDTVSEEVLKDFGVYDVPNLKIHVPLNKKIYFALPYKAQRKLRYWITEKFRFPRFFRTTKTHQSYWKNRKIDWREAYLMGKDASGQPNWNHPHRQILRMFLEKLNWMSVMEIGCGAGANLVQIALGVKGRKLQLGGTDINADAIEVAQNNGFFKDGNFLVCPNDDVLMSDKSSDVILSDMSLIYMGGKIDKTLKEYKRIARSWVVLCEFDSTNWWKRLWIKLISGYSVYDYKKLLDKHGFYDIIKYKLKDHEWPEARGTYQEGLRYIIIAKVPQNIT